MIKYCLTNSVNNPFPCIIPSVDKNLQSQKFGNVSDFVRINGVRKGSIVIIERGSSTSIS